MWTDKFACVTHTHTQCRIWGMWWNIFFVSFTADHWVTPRKGNVFICFFLSRPTLFHVYVCFIDEFPFSSELTSHIAAICLSRPILFTHIFTLLSVQETDLNGWHQWPPLPFGSLLSRPVGSSREDGREESEVKGMYLWFLSLGSFRPSWVPQQLKATADFLATLPLQVFSL